MSNNKILLVTGASSDVGIELIRTIGNDYDRIIAHYHSSDAGLDTLRGEISAEIIMIQADFNNIQSTDEFVLEIKKRDIVPGSVVHLAAPIARNNQFHKYDWSRFELEMNTSFRSIVKILRLLIPHMRKERYGRIVFMLTSYILGGVPPKYQSPYISSKYALYGLMRSLAAEYADRGITVNGVSPDMMETKFLSDIEDMIIHETAGKNPVGRNIRVTDVIPMIEYLLSEEAMCVTGQNIGITGGVR